MKKGIYLLPLLLSAYSYGQADQYQVHILKPGENLSELLYSKDYKPLYGKNNWVEKVLEMNHLKNEDAAKIKKGLPIILPHRPSTISMKKEDTISTGQASSIQYGLLGNRISKHQNIFLDFSYSQKESKLNSTTAKQNENFRIGVTYKDKNLRTMDKFSWNPVFNFGFESQGTTEFSSDSSLSASFDPTVDLTALVEVSHPSIDYKFAPLLNIKEASFLSEDGANFRIRRDRFLYLGAKVFKTYEKNNIQLNLAGQLSTSLLSQNLSGDKAMQVISTRFDSDVNLTRDYFIGLFIQRDQYSGTDLDHAMITGINLKYFVN